MRAKRFPLLLPYCAILLLAGFLVPCLAPELARAAATTQRSGPDPWFDVQSLVADVDGDRMPETVAVRVWGIERESDGQILWNDGHRWRVSVYDSGREIVLYDDYFNLGSLHAAVGKSSEKAPMTIVLIYDQMLGLSVTQFTYTGKAYKCTDVLSIEKAAQSDIPMPQ